MAVNNSAGIFDWGPTGRSIEVNASGQLLTTNEPVGGLYPLGYGKTGRALCVDGSGRLCVTSAGGGTDTTAIEADLTEVRSDFYNASGSFMTAGSDTYKTNLDNVDWLVDPSGNYYQDIAHNLGSRDLIIESYENSVSNNFRTVLVEEYERTDLNTLRVIVNSSGLNLRTVIIRV